MQDLARGDSEHRRLHMHSRRQRNCSTIMNRPPRLRLTDDLVDAALRSARQWHRDEDLPDPLQRQDLYCRPDLVAAAVGRREIEGEPWGTPSTIDYPKMHGGRRTLVALDPPSELFYRLLVASVRFADLHLSETVLHARAAEIKSDSWYVKSGRTEHRRLRQLRAKWRQERIPVGLLDVQDHYSTIQLEQLASILYSCGTPDPDVERLITNLRSLHDIPGMPGGLPINREPSAILGTVALLPLDRVISRHGHESFRWMDDIRTPGVSKSAFEDILDVSIRHLSLSGQTLNLKKSKWPEDELEEQLPSLVVEDHEMSCDEAVAALRLVYETGDFTQVNRALAVLGRARDARGLGILCDNHEILYRSPAPAGRYLKAVRFHLDAWEPLLDLVCLDERDHHAIMLVHLAHAMPHELLSDDARKRVFQLAVAAYEHSEYVLASFLFVLSTGGAQRQLAIRLRTNAFEFAQEAENLYVCRALLACLRAGGSLPQSVRRQVAEFGKRHLDLECTTEWVLSA